MKEQPRDYNEMFDEQDSEGKPTSPSYALHAIMEDECNCGKDEVKHGTCTRHLCEKAIYEQFNEIEELRSKVRVFSLVVTAALADMTPEEVGRRTRQIVWSYLHSCNSTSV